MAILGIRKRIKQVIKDVLGLSAPPSAPSTYTPPIKTRSHKKHSKKQQILLQSSHHLLLKATRLTIIPQAEENVKQETICTRAIQPRRNSPTKKNPINKKPRTREH